ncbi:MAG: 1-acyl-sn-glycerol-3-phosphate acyltransferase, partial [Leptonema sp. (in: Bacteria)]|nr:1-acyl-sn-glycerol-3-phosphate acyltransferase [Leptonema sp. (in: bacteria)]
MNTIGSILFWVFLIVTSILFFPIAVLIRLLTGLFDRRLVVLHSFTSFWASLYTWLNPFWRVTLVKKTNINPKHTYMMISNHQSMVDIFALFRTFFHFKWVSKAENFKFPFIGWNMRLNRYIEIQRGTTKGSVGMMRKAEATLKEGSSIF